MKKLLLYFAISVFLSFGFSLLGQDVTGRVIGTITDQSGAVVPNAKVTVTNVATGETREATTDSEGTYQVLLLPIGSYRVAVEASGFRRATTEPQKLEINQSMKMDRRLEIGATTET